LATSWETPRSSIKYRTARREAVRASVGEVVENLATPSSTPYPRAPHPSVRKSCSKYLQISPKKSSFCPFCRLTYIILYAIIYPVRFFFPNITFFETTYGKILWPARRGNIRPDAASAHDASVCLFAFL
jgi:hypothetical protein